MDLSPGKERYCVPVSTVKLPWVPQTLEMFKKFR